MWRFDYLESLAPFQGALSKTGATNCLERVSLVNDDGKEIDFVYTVYLLDLLSYELDFLDHVGFFTLLADLCKFRSKCIQSYYRTRARDSFERSLRPIPKVLSCLASNKVHDTLRSLKVLVDDWDGKNFFEHLFQVQQDLDKVQPKCIQSCLVQLHDLLKVKHRCLMCLACHPSMGPSNLCYHLQWLRQDLCYVLEELGEYENPLLSLQYVLDQLDEIQVIGPLPFFLEN